MQTVPYLVPHMGPWLALMCVIAIGVGLACADRSIPKSDGTDDSSAPDTYTIENIRRGGQYHVEEDGATQDFEVLSTHWSDYFQIRVLPTEGHELDRDYPAIMGWTKRLPANRLVEAKDLLPELPVELRFAAN